MKRVLPVKDTGLECALLQWIELSNSNNFPISDDLLQVKARRFATSLEINDFAAIFLLLVPYSH